MTTTYASEAETGGGKGLIWLDETGGYILVSVSNPDYTSLHKFHVAAFDGTGAYLSAGGSDEPDLAATAANIVALIRHIYTNNTGIVPIAVYKVNAAGDGVDPFSYSFPGGLSVVGDAAGAATSSACQISFTAKGTDFSRWQIHLFGPASGFWAPAVRNVTISGGDANDDIAQYLAGAAAGPGLAGHGAGKNTMVLTHAGAKIALPVWKITSENKRIRRRLKVA